MDIEKLIRNEVHLNVTGLVATIAEGAGAPRIADRIPLASLCEQAAELAAPVLDYEGAAREAGWRVSADGVSFGNDLTGEEPVVSDPRDACGWENLCNEFDIDPHDLEVYEMWAVSDHLADDLIAVGAKVDKDFAGLCVWARTETGQSLTLDASLQAVLRLMAQRYAEAVA